MWSWINKGLQEGLEYALKYAGISHVALVEWNLNEWRDRQERKAV